MTPFILEIFQPVNLAASALMILTMLYWLMVIVGVAGMDVFDFDFDGDVDLDVDADMDLDVSDSVLGVILTFLNVGKVPFMLVVSFFALVFWIATILTNHHLNPDLSLVTGALYTIPCILVGLLGAKIFSAPFAKLFASEGTTYENRERLIGIQAKVHSLTLDGQFGEIVVAQSGPPLIFNARNRTGQRLQKDDVVKIVGLDKEKDVCIVELAKWES